MRTTDLDEVANTVANVLRSAPSMKWESNATGYYDLPYKNLGLVGIVIEPTQDLRRAQQRIIDAVAPFAAETGTAEAFAPRPDGGAISQPTVDYVNSFVGSRTGVNYHPHLTIGIGTRGFVDALKAQPFEAFTVRLVSVSLYGTLWPENPMPFQAAFAFDELHRCMLTEPDLASDPMVQAALAGDLARLLEGEHFDGLMRILALTHAGMTTDEFRDAVEAWLTSAKHPRYGRSYDELTYQPMQELLRYLRANGTAYHRSRLSARRRGPHSRYATADPC